jgi:hypothetical protein
MIKYVASLALFTLAHTAVFSADVFRYPQNQTVLREQRGEIQTIFQDVRSPMITTMPGVSMYDLAQVRIGSTYSKAWWSGLEEGQRDQGRALETSVLARLRAQPWCALEVEAGVQSSQLADPIDLKNIDLRMAISLYQARYTGLSLVLGGAAAISSDGEIPGYNHESDISRWAYLTELRFTTNYGFNVFGLNIGGRWAPNVNNTFSNGLIDEDGNAIPSGKQVNNNYVRMDGRAAWSYRPFAFARGGFEYQLKWDNFEMENPNPTESSRDLSNLNHIGSTFVEVNPLRVISIVGYCGINFIRWNEGDHHDALVMGGAVQFTF